MRLWLEFEWPPGKNDVVVDSEKTHPKLFSPGIQGQSNQSHRTLLFTIQNGYENLVGTNIHLE